MTRNNRQDRPNGHPISVTSHLPITLLTRLIAADNLHLSPLTRAAINGKRLKMIYKIELQGRGILPYEFATKQAAQDYLSASFFMGKYRIHRMAKSA